MIDQVNAFPYPKCKSPSSYLGVTVLLVMPLDQLAAVVSIILMFPTTQFQQAETPLKYPAGPVKRLNRRCHDL